MSLLPFPIPLYFDADGSALEDGYIYIGEAGQNARENPIQVYWDADLTQTAAQPVRTSGGYPVYQGAPSGLFIAETAASVTVLDRNQQIILFNEDVDATGGGGGSSESAFLIESRADGLITYISASVNFVQTGGYYSAGDGGGAQFKRATGPLTDGASFQSADGAWWQYAPELIDAKHFGAKGDDAADDSAAIQAAIDYVEDHDGGVLYFSKGIYRCNVIAKQGVTLTTLAGSGGYLPSSTNYAAVLKQQAAGAVVDTPSGSTIRISIIGFSFKGLGASTAGQGIRFRNVAAGYVKLCAFDNFADQAILEDAGVANVFEDLVSTNVILNRTRSGTTGCFEMGGTDHFLNRVEGNPSLTALSSGSLYIVGIKLTGANHFLSECVGEYSDIGIHINSSSSRIVNCRADRNWGHGFFLRGPNQYTNCLALDNSQETTNTYDGFVVDAGSQGGQFNNCFVNTVASKVHRYAFVDPTGYSLPTSCQSYFQCRGFAMGTGLFLFAEFLGASAVETPIPYRVTSATPITSGTTFLVLAHAVATDITNFLDGYGGKTIRCLTTNGGVVTLKNNATIHTNTGADRVLAAGELISLTYYNTKWYEQ